jgi:hypothetical protein
LGAGADFEAVLARHVVAHIHDALLDASNGEAHPEETYFRPPIKDRLDTGDIVKYESELWVVVTPRCDLANKDKVSTVLIARCEWIGEQWGAKEGKNQPQLVQHGRSPKQHFLPLMRDVDGKLIGPWMVQFHDLRAIPMGKVPELLTPNRWASLAPQFVPSLVERFGAYFSRIGTPSLTNE